MQTGCSSEPRQASRGDGEKRFCGINSSLPHYNGVADFLSSSVSPNLDLQQGDQPDGGFHGLLYLDPTTLNVRRISIDADDVPPALHVRASSMSVDYSWISMQGHDFLLPVHGAVSLQVNRGRPVLNEFEFRDYHRFGSQSRIIANN